MQDIRRQFLQTSVEDLRQSMEFLRSEDDPAKFYRHLFRLLHTIKGTAQAFGLVEQSKLAHVLENLLSTDEKSDKTRNVLLEGLQLLTDSLEKDEFEIPPSFLEKAREAAPASGEVKGVFLSLIPPNVYDQLTEYEKSRIASALKDNKSLYCLDVIFEISDFADGLRRLQETIRKDHEIIFTLPSENSVAPNQIGFQLFLSGTEDTEALESGIQDFNAKLTLQTSTAGSSHDLAGVLSQIAAQGKALARSLGKQTKISILSDEPDLSTEKLKLVFDSLLHLVRNAVVHSTEDSGVIEIRIKEESGGLQITVFNDGDGVDLKKVKAKAVEKNLILPDTPLSEQEILEFIFLPGFSTADNLSEVAGRGVGLDAVRDLVINTGGTIGIENQKGIGTTFEIFLPLP